MQFEPAVGGVIPVVVDFESKDDLVIIAKNADSLLGLPEKPRLTEMGFLMSHLALKTAILVGLIGTKNSASPFFLCESFRPVAKKDLVN